MSRRVTGLTLVIVCGLMGCSPSSHRPDAAKGRYQQSQDSAPDHDHDVSSLADAIPRWEPQTIAGNRSPYWIGGKEYRVLPTQKGYSAEGIASWYGQKFHGYKTANGEIYDMFAMSAAHRSLPIPSYVRVTNLNNQRQVVVRVNDRGPFHDQRVIDLSYAAAKKLGFLDAGTTAVRLEALDPVKDAVTPSVARVQMASQKVHKAATLPDNTFLQVGAYSLQSKARELRTQLASMIDMPVLVVPHEQRALFRVRIGPIVDHWQLANARSILKQHDFLHTQLVSGT